MKAYSLAELKRELKLLPANDLVDLCVSLARYKKDNKDFLSYLLIESYDKPAFVGEIKTELSAEFNNIAQQSNLYYAKKSLRKLLRIITKYSKYFNDKAISCDLHIFFCRQFLDTGIPFQKSQQLINMYEQQLKKIDRLIEGLHEDLQHDYRTELQSLNK